MADLRLTIDGMSCGHCVAAVQEAIEGISDVVVNDVSIGHANITVAEHSSVLDAINLALEAEGYELTSVSASAIE